MSDDKTKADEQPSDASHCSCPHDIDMKSFGIAMDILKDYGFENLSEQISEFIKGPHLIETISNGTKPIEIENVVTEQNVGSLADILEQMNRTFVLKSYESTQQADESYSVRWVFEPGNGVVKATLEE